HRLGCLGWSGRLGRPARPASSAVSMPLAPALNQPCPVRLEGLEERRDGHGRGGLSARSESERKSYAVGQFAHEGDIARTCARVLPGHRAVVREVLPAVTPADIAGARAHPCIVLVLVGGGER